MVEEHGWDGWGGWMRRVVEEHGWGGWMRMDEEGG
jgi:hypothetical protein